MIRKNLNHDWRVMKGGSSASTAAFMGTANVQNVHLPHDAMIHEVRTWRAAPRRDSIREESISTRN